MTEERMSKVAMQRRLSTVTAKTELVLLDDAMWARDGDGWVKLQGERESAVPDDSGTAPLSGVTPQRAPAEGMMSRPRDEATGNVSPLPPDNQI